MKPNLPPFWSSLISLQKACKSLQIQHQPRQVVLAIALGLSIQSCVATQPADVSDVCSIFEDKRSWYKAAKRTEQTWNIPVPVTMAFIYQESSFRPRAKPARNRFLWIFPGARPSSAYGYAQAVDATWDDYMASTGNWDAIRSDFSDAADFVGWYNSMSNRLNNIATDDAAHLYLAYHEGNAGYSRGSHLEKQWLINTAATVQANSERFSVQYNNCRNDLEKNWFFRLFS